MKTTQDPAVSVVMPVRDGERYLEAAVGSVLSQSLASLELIVVDDGSSDRTPAILDRLAANDRRLVVIRQEGLGLVAALTRGCAAAQAPLIARLDADDIAYPQRLAAQCAAFAADPDLVLLGASVDVVDAQTRITSRIAYPATDDALRRALRERNPFVHPAVMLRRSAFENAGGYRPALEFAEDYDLWLRLSEFGRIGNLGEHLGAYRVHAGQVTIRKAYLQAWAAALARQSAEARRRGEPDPLAGFVRLPLPHEPLPPQLAPLASLYRLLSFAHEGGGVPDRATLQALKAHPLLAAPERKLARNGLAELAADRSLGLAERMRIALAAAALGGVRGIRETVRAHRSRTAPR